MEHMKWLEAITAGDSAREIGPTCRCLIPGTVANQIEPRTKASAEVVIKIAEGYSKTPVRALVDTGYRDRGSGQRPSIPKQPSGRSVRRRSPTTSSNA